MNRSEALQAIRAVVEAQLAVKEAARKLCALPLVTEQSQPFRDMRAIERKFHSACCCCTDWSAVLEALEGK